MSPEQSEIDQLAENELSRLQKQHRKLQLELTGLLEERKTSLLKQERIIDLLQKEHEKLKEEVHLLQDKNLNKKEHEDEKQFENISLRYVHEQKSLKQEKFGLLELEAHIKKLEREIDSQRKDPNQVTDNCYKENIQRVKKDVVKLENRLDVVNKKSSDVLTEIYKLRESIDHILQDRTLFNDLWQSMVTQFNDGKKYIMDLVDQSTLAYDQREEICTKLQALKDRNETDKILHIQEMREVQRKLEHDEKLQVFYNIKGQKRIDSELEEREIAKSIAMREELEKQLEEYKLLIEKIKETCEENDIEKIYSQFTTQEEENFALFNYVNELGHEVEVLNETVESLTEDIEKQKAELIEIAIKKETETIEHLENVKKTLLDNVHESDSNKKQINNELLRTLEGIENLFKLIRTGSIPILNVLSTKHFISVHNVKLFLGIIEKRINVLVNNINTEEQSNKILSKKDRVPKFNVKDSVKIKEK